MIISLQAGTGADPKTEKEMGEEKKKKTEGRGWRGENMKTGTERKERHTSAVALKWRPFHTNRTVTDCRLRWITQNTKQWFNSNPQMRGSSATSHKWLAFSFQNKIQESSNAAIFSPDLRAAGLPALRITAKLERHLVAQKLPARSSRGSGFKWDDLFTICTFCFSLCGSRLPDYCYLSTEPLMQGSSQWAGLGSGRCSSRASPFQPWHPATWIRAKYNMDH